MEMVKLNLHLPVVRCAAVLLVAWPLSALPASAETTPVNCSTAEGDIRALNSEKQYAQSHRPLEVASLTPAGALLGLATGTEEKRLKMLAPEYITRIDARIDDIKTTCGVAE